jgi:hypothetical protein
MVWLAAVWLAAVWLAVGVGKHLLHGVGGGGFADGTEADNSMSLMTCLPSVFLCCR